MVADIDEVEQFYNVSLTELTRLRTVMRRAVEDFWTGYGATLLKEMPSILASVPGVERFETLEPRDMLWLRKRMERALQTDAKKKVRASASRPEEPWGFANGLTSDDAYADFEVVESVVADEIIAAIYDARARFMDEGFQSYIANDSGHTHME